MPKVACHNKRTTAISFRSSPLFLISFIVRRLHFFFYIEHVYLPQWAPADWTVHWLVAIQDYANVISAMMVIADIASKTTRRSDVLFVRESHHVAVMYRYYYVGAPTLSYCWEFVRNTWIEQMSQNTWWKKWCQNAVAVVFSRCKNSPACVCIASDLCMRWDFMSHDYNSQIFNKWIKNHVLLIFCAPKIR